MKVLKERRIELPSITIKEAGISISGHIAIELRETDKGPELSFAGTLHETTRPKTGYYSGGQNVDTIQEFYHDPAIQRICNLWDRWHLNGMRAGCEHQRAAWNAVEQLEVVEYGLTTEASRLRSEAMERVARGAANAKEIGHPPRMTETERALIALRDWFKPVFTPPDADSPLSGCYEVKKHKTKTSGHTYPAESPRGILCKPCETCGYKYGSAWLYEAIPAEVITELFNA